MTIQYVPQGFGPNDLIGPHDGLRVTFAQSRSIFTPDSIESADLRDNVQHLFRAMEGGGFALAPASDITVVPGDLAVTVDFVVASSGYLTVAQALDQLSAGLYGPLDFLKRTYIRRVERIGSSTWGSPIPNDLDRPDVETGWLGVGALGLAIAAGVAVVFFAPELKAALGMVRGRRG